MFKIDTLDYSKEESWVDIHKCGTKPVDVFFIIPTLIDASENEDGYASISELFTMACAVRIGQTSVFEDSCNVYMPFYRQADMVVAGRCHKDNALYLDTLYNSKAYADIVAALDYYFEKYNHGKPFILASHSQGSAMAINVLTHYMQEHKDYLARMIAAYPIGYAPDEGIFNEQTGLKFATCADDFNVVVSFTTEGPTAKYDSILLPKHPMVINPLNWKTDDTYASVAENKGQIKMSPNYDSASIEAGSDDAQINLTRKTLICRTRGPEFYAEDENPEYFGTESFHAIEYLIYHANLKENVQTRIDAYFAHQK